MRYLVSCLVFVAILSAPVSAVTFNCGTVMLIQAGLGQPAHNPAPIEKFSFEASLALALSAMEKASPQAAKAFRFRAFDVLEDIEIVTTNDRTFEKPYRFVFPNRQPYAAVPRVRVWRAPLLVWPEQQNANSAALAAVRLVYEVAALKKLPPNTVRVWRQLNGSQRAFLDNAVASLHSQYLVYVGLLKMRTAPVLPRRSSFSSRWSALFRGRATRNPYYRGLELTQDLVRDLDAALKSVSAAEHLMESLQSYVENHYRTLLRVDRAVNATLSLAAVSGIAYGGMLISDMPIAEHIPDSVDVRVEFDYGNPQAEKP